MRNALAPRDAVLPVGELAPDFSLPTHTKAEWRLSDHLRTGDVVLCVVPFAFTGVCGVEMRCISSDFDTWSAKGAHVVGLCCDSPAANAAWAEKEHFRHPILSDLHRNVVRGYGLYWPELNVARRGTVVISGGPKGTGRVTFSESREPGKAMNWNAVLATL